MVEMCASKMEGADPMDNLSNLVINLLEPEGSSRPPRAPGKSPRYR